jgi:ribosomal protein L3 glutamine methyltransferase
LLKVLCSGSLEFILGLEPGRILDLCTGNGSLAVLAALQWSHAKLEGLEISEPALEVARINAEAIRLGYPDRLDGQ